MKKGKQLICYINGEEIDNDEFIMELMSLDHNNEFVMNNHLDLMKEGHTISFTTQNKTLRMTGAS